MIRRKGFTSNKHSVSPVIATILMVAICVVIASIVYVWMIGFTDNVGDTVVEPVSFNPELNIERIQEELSLKIIIGERIEWDNYKVTVNNTVLTTTPGMESGVGEIVFFDYSGGKLTPNSYYELQVVDLRARMVVYSDDIPALAYRPKGTGVYGIVTSSATGEPIHKAFVSVHISGQLYTITTTDISGAYKLTVPEGFYEIVCEVNSTVPETFGMEFAIHVSNMSIAENCMLRYDISLPGGSPKSSMINGHVYDQTTGLPLSSVKIKFTDDLYFNKQKKTDSGGYYSLSLRARTLSIICEQNGYKRYVYNVTVADSETKTVDIYLETIPIRQSVVYGYVYDNATGSPLIGEKVYAHNNYETNRTKTNVQGYFTFNIVPGNVTVTVDVNKYEHFEIDLVLAQDEYYRLDIYLDKI